MDLSLLNLGNRFFRSRLTRKIHFFTRDLGIDLGTANTLVYVKGRGIVLQEPSVIAIDTRTREILAVGEKAREMIGRTPGNVVAIRPLREGVIADFKTTKSMLQYFIAQAMGGKLIFSPRVVVGIPLGITQVEKKAVWEATKQAGAKEAYLIEEPVAAAIGAGLPVEQPRGSLIVDIGGGTTEIALISLGGVVRGHSLRIGGDAINESLIRYMRREYGLDIGERTAEDIKIAMGFATDPDPKERMYAKGLNISTGLPNAVEVTAVEISRAIADPIYNIVQAIHSTLERTPAELAADIMEYGVTLTGGGALIKNLDKLIDAKVRIPVRIADDPMSCVAKGTGKVLDQIHILKRIAYTEAK